MLDHDGESGLDHAQARHYNSSHGHWLSPDPYDGSYHWRNPQSFNRYAYALNRPLSRTDPSGMDALCSTEEDYATQDCGDAGSGGGGDPPCLESEGCYQVNGTQTGVGDPDDGGCLGTCGEQPLADCVISGCVGEDPPDPSNMLLAQRMPPQMSPQQQAARAATRPPGRPSPPPEVTPKPGWGPTPDELNGPPSALDLVIKLLIDAAGNLFHPLFPVMVDPCLTTKGLCG